MSRLTVLALLYNAILCSWADSLCSHVILHKWLAFYSAFLNIHRSGVLTALAWLVPHETVAVSAQVLCTPYNHAPYDFMQSHMHRSEAERQVWRFSKEPQCDFSKRQLLCLWLFREPQLLHEVCLKSNGTGVTNNLFQFQTTNYMVSPSK